MLKKYTFVLFAHCACVAVLLKIFNLILPCCVTCLYSCAANFLLFLLVAGFTFRFTKRKHLNDKLQPENRAVLITGCDSGFGYLLATHLDSLGFHVFASCLNPEGYGASELAKSCSKRLQTLSLDVTKDESVKKALEFVKDNLGTSELWALVNNAGIFKGFDTELTKMSDFRDCMEVNALGPVRVTKAFLPLLRQSRGRVINLTSILGRIPSPYLSPYVMSKYAFAGFSDCLRQELDTWGIRVISVEPELFETNLTSNESVSKSADETIDALEDNLKADYGEKYVKNFRIFVEYHTGLASSKLYKVITALEYAVSMEYPDTVYRPSRSCAVKYSLFLYEVLPHIIKDIITRFILYITGFPKPKEASNVS